jgi:CCR4-NOT complex subunit CAF16
MLIDLLDVNTAWHMHQVSDGERRRVQLLLGLIKPYSVLYLDEVTVDLDVMVRRDFLNFLKQETEQRGATIVYATHIFDGVGDWASHICHMSNGTVRVMQPLDEVAELAALRAEHQRAGYGDSPLLRLVETWLRAEFEERKQLRRMHVAEPPNEIERKKDMREYGDKYYNYWTQ